MQVVATRPDGSVVPLLWVKQANVEYQQIYYYAGDVSLPAGTTISVIPPGGGSFSLFWKPAEPPKRK